MDCNNSVLPQTSEQIDIAQLHIPKKGNKGKNKEKSDFKHKYVSSNPEWIEMTTRLKIKSSECKRKGKSTNVTGTI